MPIPSTVADLSTTASANYPAGSESPNQLDDYHRALASIVRQVSDAKADTSHTQAASTISDSTAAGRALLTAADAAAQRTALGLGTAATSASSSFATSGAVTGNGNTMATGKILGRSTASTGAIEEITVGTGLNLSAGVLSASGSNSFVRLNTFNSYGSTNTKIKRYSTVVNNQGSDITYSDSSTLGASFTINTSGVYSISITDNCSSSACTFGATLNTATPNSTIQSCSINEILCITSTASPSFSGSTSWTGYINSGSVVRSHGDGNSGLSLSTFSIQRVA